MPNTSSSVFGGPNRQGDSLRSNTSSPEGHGDSLRPRMQPPQHRSHEEDIKLLQNTPIIEATHLGKSVEYTSTYNPKLLVPVPRLDNRMTIGLSNDNLPFIGYDVWNCYEVSCLAANGAPITGIAKIKYSSDSPFIIESKSLKLYLYSYNMTKIGEKGMSAKEIRIILEKQIATDLSECLKTQVQINIFDPNHRKYNESAFTSYLDNWTNIDEDHGCTIETMNDGLFEYNENPKLLKAHPRSRNVDLTVDYYYSNNLRSNCKITKQPDWGSVFITHKGDNVLTQTDLVQYIVSFRNENHFHEEICETIYKRLYDIYRPHELSVACFYTRRGGIDINPIRASHKHLLDQWKNFLNVESPSYKLPRQ